MKANTTSTQDETTKTKRRTARKTIDIDRDTSIVEETTDTSVTSNIETELSKKLNEIDSKISAVELIQEFNERLNSLTIVTNNSGKDNTEKTTSKINFLGSLFRSNSGNSSMRMIFFVWAIGTWVIWAAMSLYKNDLQPISSELAAVLAALGAAKMGQTFGENKFKKTSSGEEE